MKHFIIILILLVNDVASAQQPDLKILATAGTTYVIQNVQLDWTLGETVILTFDSPPTLLTQGFQQPSSLLVNNTYPIPFIEFISLAPNPASEQITLSASFPSHEYGFIQMHDFTGKAIWQQSFSGQTIEEQYAINDIPPGEYIITILLTNYKTHQSSTFIKIK